MILKPIADLTLADVEALAMNGVAEGRTLEFKAEFPGPKDDDKREFLYDVTSLANTDGGDLIFGVTAVAGVATAVPGAPLTDTLDATLLRLESLLSSCVEPRLLGAKPQAFSMPTGFAVVVWRIPASFAAPHRAYFKGAGRFYRRNSRGKAEMDTHELRAAFNASEGFPARLAALHSDAVRLVEQRDLPFLMREGPRVVLSIIPLALLRNPSELDLDHTTSVFPPSRQSLDWLHALEGFYVFDVSNSAPTNAFALTRRTGQVDFSWQTGSGNEKGEPTIWPFAVEDLVAGSAASAAQKLRAFGIEGPFGIGLTLVGVKGFRLHQGFFDVGQAVEAWRDRLSLPVIVAQNLDHESLMPVLRSFWYAMGVKRPDKPLGGDK